MERQAEGASPTSARPSRWASRDSLEIIQETGVGNDEANQLFMFTQWSEMMTEFARTGKTRRSCCRADFSQSASMFRADAGRRQSSKRFEGVDAREITVVCVGKPQGALLEGRVLRYTKRLGAYAKVDIREVADIRSSQGGPGVDAARDKERRGDSCRSAASSACDFAGH